MSDQSSTLQLPFLRDGQAQKHVTVNESLLRLDAIVQLAVVSATTTAEPGAPSDGQVYILPGGKTGEHWGAMGDHALAYYRDGAWEEIIPREGWCAFVKDSDAMLVFTGAAWSAMRSALAAAGLADANVFTGSPQTISAADLPALRLLRTSGAANAKEWRIETGSSDRLFFDTYNDSGVWVGSPAILTRAGALTLSAGLIAGGAVLPAVDDTHDLGSASFRWDDVFATNGVIQTSDAREKTALEEIPEGVKRAVRRIIAGIGAFRWRDSVAAKGPAARLHVGVTAQDVREAFKREGENAEHWALFCCDELDGPPDEIGAPRVRLGVRYDQLFALALAVLFEACVAEKKCQ